MNFRSIVIETALNFVIAPTIQNTFNALEIGCMFDKNEGLSTYLIARFAHTFAGEKQFASIEYNQEHINKAILLLNNEASGIKDEVTFHCGHSLSLLPNILQNMKTIDFALLAGGAHPEVCLQEFELVLEKLSNTGLILIDDLHEIAPSEAYPLPRLFGKGSLILPFLTIANYLKSRPTYRNANIVDEKSSIPDSSLLSMVNSSGILTALESLEFTVITKGNHKMLAVGGRLTLERLQAALNDDVNCSALGASIPIPSTASSKQIQLFETVSDAINRRNFDAAILAIHEIIELDPFNNEATNLWKQIDATRKNSGLPYMFPGGLGQAQSVDGIYGLLTEGDLQALRFAAEHARGVSVNIGVFNGLSSYVIAMANPSLQVFGIDAFLGMTAQNLEINSAQQKIAEHNLSLTGNAKLLVGLSNEIAKTWSEKIGFLFIDGNHLVEGAVSDFQLWSPFVEDGGFIAVHDTYGRVSSSILRVRESHNSHGPDVVCAMMADDPQFEFVLASGSTQVWRKHSYIDTTDTAEMELANSSLVQPAEERHLSLAKSMSGTRNVKFCAETCIIFVSFGRTEIAARSYASLVAAIAPYRDRIKIIISDATDDVHKFEWARATDADDIIFTPRFTPAATSRNLATSLMLDKYAPKYLCMLEDDFEYQPAWYPALVSAAENLYGSVSPFGLGYGIFSACDHHIPVERMVEDPTHGVTAYLFGAVAYQRFMPTSHYLCVMRGWDPDLLGISYAQTGGQTFRNTMRGFCGAVLPGQLSRPIDYDSSASTWSKGKRDPGPPAHSFVLQDYDVIRNAAIKQGTYARHEK